MGSVKRISIGQKAFYTLKTESSEYILDHMALLFGFNHKYPSFSSPRKPLKFLVKDMALSSMDAVYVTRPDIGALCLESKKIFITKPVFYQIMLQYDTYKSQQMTYEDQKVETGMKLYSIDDIDIEEFKRSVRFVSHHEIVTEADFKVQIISSGANLGWINLRFMYNDQSMIYLTSYSTKDKFFAKHDSLVSDTLLINMENKDLFYREVNLSKNKLEIVNELKVNKKKTKTIEELCKKNNIADPSQVEKHAYYEIKEEETVKKKHDVKKVVASDQLPVFQEYLKHILSKWDASLFIKYDTDNLVEMLITVIKLIEVTSINLYVVCPTFEKFYIQLNNQSEWLKGDVDSEPFPFKKYKYLIPIKNLNYDFTNKQKIILINKNDEIPEIFADQKIIQINATKEEKMTSENSMNFLIRMESNIEEIKKVFSLKNPKSSIHVNVEELGLNFERSVIPLMINEHTNMYDGRIYAHGVLKITDFYSNRRVEYSIEQKEHWIYELLCKNDHVIVNNMILIPDLDRKFSILESGEIIEVVEVKKQGINQ